jgi:hypothetical protein
MGIVVGGTFGSVVVVVVEGSVVVVVVEGSLVVVVVEGSLVVVVDGGPVVVVVEGVPVVVVVDGGPVVVGGCVVRVGGDVVGGGTTNTTGLLPVGRAVISGVPGWNRDKGLKTARCGVGALTGANVEMQARCSEPRVATAHTRTVIPGWAWSMRRAKGASPPVPAWLMWTVLVSA